MDATSLSADLRQAIASRSVEWTFPVGENVIAQETFPNRLVVVLCGSVEVGIIEPNGRLHVLAHRREGSIIGEMAFLLGVPHTAQVRAITPVRALLLPSGDYRSLARERPELESSLMCLMTARLAVEQQDCFAKRRYSDILWTAATAEMSPEACVRRARMLVRWLRLDQ